MKGISNIALNLLAPTLLRRAALKGIGANITEKLISDGHRRKWLLQLSFKCGFCVNFTYNPKTRSKKITMNNLNKSVYYVFLNQWFVSIHK